MDQLNFAKQLRQNMTDAEHRLWRHLRDRRLDGHKFRRQRPIGPYIVDFVNIEARLVVEADGGQHNSDANDQERDHWLQQRGYRIMRFWNNEILQNTEEVLAAILQALNDESG
ncbi:endonuclease domain-containing protein [Mangrovitalea sediminis]|uniref:endonuclease domain-containing protein n=1 Tax=Mangrovitalea sediminis TaxID=1982043 RepID=UPI000BE4D960|nr:DUF559 domain-containing protein [Mangrovitalea sediminis]